MDKRESSLQILNTLHSRKESDGSKVKVENADGIVDYSTDISKQSGSSVTDGKSEALMNHGRR